MTMVQRLQGDFTITDPAWPRYKMWQPGHVFTSDDFTTAATGPGALTDAALGGAPHPWDISVGGWSKTDGKLVHTGSGNLLMALPHDDALVEVKFLAHTGTSTWAFTMRRPGNTFNEGHLQFMVYPGTIELRENPADGGPHTLLGRGTHAITAGDVIGFQHQAGRMTLLVNGQEIASETLSTVAHSGLKGHHIGFTTISSNATGNEIDWIKITALQKGS